MNLNVVLNYYKYSLLNYLYIVVLFLNSSFFLDTRNLVKRILIYHIVYSIGI